MNNSSNQKYSFSLSLSLRGKTQLAAVGFIIQRAVLILSVRREMDSLIGSQASSICSVRFPLFECVNLISVLVVSLSVETFQTFSMLNIEISNIQANELAA